MKKQAVGEVKPTPSKLKRSIDASIVLPMPTVNEKAVLPYS